LLSCKYSIIFFNLASGLNLRVHYRNLIVEGTINDVNIQDITSNKTSITDLETNIQSHSDKIDTAEQDITELQTENTSLKENIHTKNTNTGTTHDIFVLDSDDSSLSDIKLQFGKTLAKVFKWTKEFTRFELGDSLFVFGNISNNGNTILGDDETDATSVNGDFNVSGNALITGTINGVNVQEITNLKSDVTTAKDDITNLKSDVSTAKDDITNLKSDTTTAKDDITNLKSDVTTAKDDITNLKSDVTTAKDDITNLKSDVTTAKDDITNLQTKTNTLETQIHSQNTDTGTSQDTFILDNDDSALTDIKIQFGKTIAKVFKWTKELSRFELGDSLFVFGNIENNGNTILGDDIDDTTSVNGDFNVSGNTLMTGTINNRNITTDGEKIDTMETNAAADQNATEVPVTLESLTSTNVQDALSEIHTLASQKTTSTQYATFSWDYIPGTKDNAAKMSKGIVMLHSGTITGLSINTDPSHKNKNGTFVITKNDDGSYEKKKRMSLIRQNKIGTGDKKNSAYTNKPLKKEAGITFKKGDVLRTYHIGNTQENNSILVEVTYK
jgi:predicted  nucleic acid-binding Zn-ribbon protein